MCFCTLIVYTYYKWIPIFIDFYNKCLGDYIGIGNMKNTKKIYYCSTLTMKFITTTKLFSNHLKMIDFNQSKIYTMLY